MPTTNGLCVNLRQLEVFYAIMQAGTVSGAAKNLHVSQPNVTRVLAHTEQQLGFTLFERVKGRLVATQEANTLLPKVESIYGQLDQFRALTNKLKKGQQHIRVGAPPVLASHFLAPLVANFYQLHQCSVELVTGNRNELCDGLLNNELDIAVTFGQDTPAGISHQLLIDTSMQALIPLPCHDLIPSERAPVPSVALEALLQHPLTVIALDRRDPLGQKVTYAIEQVAPSFSPSLTVRSYAAGAELAKLGAGIAIVDPWTAAQYANHGALQLANLHPAVNCSVSLLTSDVHPQSITAKQFLSALHRHT